MQNDRTQNLKKRIYILIDFNIFPANALCDYCQDINICRSSVSWIPAAVAGAEDS